MRSIRNSLARIAADSALKEDSAVAKRVLAILITMIITIMTGFCPLASAYYQPACALPHNQIPISRLKSVAEDFSAPRNQRVAAICCLGDYGTEGARILIDLLERNLKNYEATRNILETLGRIEERSVIPALIAFVGKLDTYRRGGSSPSFPVEYVPSYRYLAIDTLIPIAWAAYNVPVSDPPDPNQTLGSVVLCGGDSFAGFSSKGERPTESDAEEVIALLKRIKNNPEMARTETDTLELASEGLATIENIIELLRKNGPKLIYAEAYGVDEWKRTYYIQDASRSIHDRNAFADARGRLDVIDGVLATESVNALKSVLDDSSDNIRRRAVLLLGYSRQPGAIPAVYNCLQHDPSLKVRLQAAESLGRLAGEQAVPALQEAHADDPSLVRGVISGLGFAGGEGVPILINMLKDEVNYPTGGPEAIESILHSLQKSGDRRAIQPMIDLVLNPVVSLRSIKEGWGNADFQHVRCEAATILARFVTDDHYRRILHYQGKSAEGLPVTPSEDHKVKEGDRDRVFAAVRRAGYDVEDLAVGYMKLYDSDTLILD